MSPLYDPRQVRRAFARAAAGYEAAAGLQREIEARLLESLDYLDERQPGVVLDVGAGPGHASAAIKRRWPKARVIALDLALPMLRQARRKSRWWRRLDCLCAEAGALPLREASVDVIFSNLCLQWTEDLPAALAGFRRVLKPGGLLLCSTFGPQTLQELREAFASADDRPHVSPFAAIQQFGDALLAAGFRDPVLDRDRFGLHYPDLPALMRTLRAIGAVNALDARRRSLTGKARMRRVFAAYEARREAAGLPATWEAIYAHAWGPPPGAPRREGGVEIASVPLAAIPIRPKTPRAKRDQNPYFSATPAPQSGLPSENPAST